MRILHIIIKYLGLKYLYTLSGTLKFLFNSLAKPKHSIENEFKETGAVRIAGLHLNISADFYKFYDFWLPGNSV